MNVDSEKVTVTLSHKRGLFGPITGQGKTGAAEFRPVITGGGE